MAKAYPPPFRMYGVQNLACREAAPDVQKTGGCTAPVRCEVVRDMSTLIRGGEVIGRGSELHRLFGVLVNELGCRSGRGTSGSVPSAPGHRGVKAM